MGSFAIHVRHLQATNSTLAQPRANYIDDMLDLKGRAVQGVPSRQQPCFGQILVCSVSPNKITLNDDVNKPPGLTATSAGIYYLGNIAMIFTGSAGSGYYSCWLDDDRIERIIAEKRV